jgi:zinc transport system substrate-binding protein
MVFRSAVAAVLIASLGDLAIGASADADEAPAVVVSIKPLHSLVAGVMEGVGEPALLIEGASSPHSYAMRPSEAEALARAEVVFWVGEGLEGFLVKPITALSDDARVVAPSEAEGLRLLPTREGGMWQEHGAEVEHGEHEHEHEEEHEHGQVDMHVWLDPQNAEVMVGTIAATLSEVDAERAGTYQANAAKLGADLARLDDELVAALAPVRDRPFVVFHDGYQYFEDRYGLNAIGSMAVDPARPPGAARLQEIRAKLEDLDAACVFAEPQFRPALVHTVVEGTGAGTGVLDPLGADQDAGPDQYFQLLEALSQSLVDCLGTPRSG